MRKFFVLLLFCVTAVASEHPGTEEFVQKAVSEYGLPEADVRALLDEAEYKQSIIDAISRPAEGKPWHEYRQIFLTDKRIAEGVDFWLENPPLSFADCYHLALASHLGLGHIYTFDKKMGRYPGVERIEP